MIKKITYRLISGVLVFLISCGEPNPTELILDDASSDNDNFDIELLSPESDSFAYENGYDTTGVVLNRNEFASLISLSGVRTTYKGNNRISANALAIFFDKTKPVINSSGDVVAYKTFELGSVFFNNKLADKRPLHFKYRDNGAPVDTVLGPEHTLKMNLNGSGSGDFHFENKVNMKIKVGTRIVKEADIPTPKEIIGKIKLLVDPDASGFAAELTWNRSAQRKIDIIIGGISENSALPVPLIKISVRDDGKLAIPKSLLRSLPYANFNKIVFSLIRSYKAVVQSDQVLNYNLIMAQSIHNIIIDVK